MASGFNIGSFFARWVFALALVLGTYNPTQYSYISWIFSEGVPFILIQVLRVILCIIFPQLFIYLPDILIK